jgi:hypothetical protein
MIGRSATSLLVIASCTLSGGDGATVSVEPNALGVTKLVVHRSERGGDRRYELRGVDDHDSELASVQLRTGLLGELGGVSGSELAISIGGAETRFLSRETQLFDLSGTTIASSPFLAIPAVASTLEHDANIIVQSQPMPADEPHVLASCSPNDVTSGVMAYQCCMKLINYLHLMNNPIWPNETIVLRRKGAAACTAQGGGPCAGGACYYGPNGFSRPVYTPPGPGQFARIFADSTGFGNGWLCASGFVSSDPAPQFTDVAGSFPAGQGCPGGGSGAGEWDL